MIKMNNRIHGISGNEDGFSINVWAPYINNMHILIENGSRIKLEKDEYGYFHGNFDCNYYATPMKNLYLTIFYASPVY